MKLRCITGNANKFREIEALVPFPLIQQEVDLPEIQELSLEAVVAAKIDAARPRVNGAFIVEDTALSLACLGGALPGPLVKWFEKSIGIEGIAALAEKYGNARAIARSAVGYVDPSGVVSIFVGEVSGTIVPPRGTNDFGWGPIFVPEGATETFGQMLKAQKNKVSMRARALEQLVAHVTKQA